MAGVLIIDDDPMVRLPTRLILQKAGHDVTEAMDGEEGLQFFKESSADLVLVDYKMPGIDGHEVVRELRNLSPKTKIIFATGWDTPEEHSADRVLAKPFGQSGLLAIVEELLQEGNEQT